jgi:hypothetical protein
MVGGSRPRIRLKLPLFRAPHGVTGGSHIEVLSICGDPLFIEPQFLSGSRRFLDDELIVHVEFLSGSCFANSSRLKHWQCEKSVVRMTPLAQLLPASVVVPPAKPFRSRALDSSRSSAVHTQELLT